MFVRLFLSGAVVLATLGAAPQALPTPAPVATAAADLPEIGRVRSLSPACAALRESVIPAFAATVAANKRFDTIAPTFGKLAEVLAEEKDNTAVRDMYLSRMGQETAGIFQEAQKIAKALGDPRLKAKSGDAAAELERAQLQQLYDVQMDRANILNEFLIRQNVAIGRTEFSDNSAFDGNRTGAAGGGSGAAPAPQATATPLDIDRRRFGQPVLSGKNGFADKHVMNDWSLQLAMQAKSSTEAAAKVFYPLGKACSAASN